MMLDWKRLGILLLCLCPGGVLGIEAGAFGVGVVTGRRRRPLRRGALDA